jgi:predicted RND superfamily exporter protein
MVPPAPDHPQTPAHRFTRRYVAWTLRHGRVLWGLAILLAIPATWQTAKLYQNLRSDIEHLLPRDAPSVVALAELRSRMPGLQYLGVLVEVGAAGPARQPVSAQRLAAGERLIDDLAARIRTYPPELVRAVRSGFQAERTFVEKNLALFLDLPDLQQIRTRIEDRVHWEYAKETDILLDPDEPAPSLDFSDIEQRYRQRVGANSLVGDRFSSAELGVALLLVETGGFSSGATKAAELLRRVQADLAALGGPERYGAGIRVGFTGDVAISAEEMAALVEDLTLSSLLVVVAVVLALMLFYRWRRSVPALLFPLAIGAVCAFALATLPPFGITELNSNTAFLGSIIIGNGINFGIIQLARYVEARRRGETVEDALVTSLWGTFQGTLSAAVAAGAAYGSLVAMQFRGFRQFGVIGGLGMVLCWIATFLLGPPLIAWLDRGRLHQAERPPLLTRPPRRRLGAVGIPSPMGAFSRWVANHPRALAVAGVVVTVASLWEVRSFGSGQLEYDFSRMRRRDTWSVGEGYWGRKMDTLLGQYLTPTVLLTDTPAEARAIAAKLRQAMAKPPLDAMVASVRTLDDVFPSDQPAKIAEVEALRRKLSPRLRTHISPEDNAKLDRLLGSGPLRPFTEKEVPEVLTTGLRERDGSAAKAVLVFPKPGKAMLWKGESMSYFVTALREIAESPRASGGRAARVAGGPPLTNDIIESMYRDGPLASLLAFLGVVAAVLVMFRRGLATPFVIGSLVVGVLWLLAATMLLDIKINFINFIAFPITFGIGVDYAVNVMGRYLRDGTGDVAAAVRETGGAVGLCSLTTMIGYSSLLVAQNVGLFLFGLLAVLGEITCLTSAVILLPAVLILVRKRTRAMVSEQAQPNGKIQNAGAPGSRDEVVPHHAEPPG